LLRPAVRFLAALMWFAALVGLGTARVRLGTVRPGTARLASTRPYAVLTRSGTRFAGSGRSLCRILAGSSTTLFLQSATDADLALMPGEGPCQQDDDHRQQDEGDERPDPGTGIFRFNPAITGEQDLPADCGDITAHRVLRSGGQPCRGHWAAHLRSPANKSSSGTSLSTSERASSYSS